uniref:Uncharacterized protein n=1 Tax=Trichuris muris TaxID=70415 RepID=A0A5S6QI84_TRIMR
MHHQGCLVNILGEGKCTLRNSCEVGRHVSPVVPYSAVYLLERNHLLPYFVTILFTSAEWKKGWNGTVPVDDITVVYQHRFTVLIKLELLFLRTMCPCDAMAIFC